MSGIARRFILSLLFSAILLVAELFRPLSMLNVIYLAWLASFALVLFDTISRRLGSKK